MWLHSQRFPDSPLYNDRSQFTTPATWMFLRLKQASTIFASPRGLENLLYRNRRRARQEVKPELLISLPVVDLRQLPEDQRNSTAASIATLDAATPLDVTQAPLFRARLIRLEDQQYRLYLVLSHIIFDGVAIYRSFFCPNSRLCIKPESRAVHRRVKELEIQ